MSDSVGVGMFEVFELKELAGLASLLLEDTTDMVNNYI
jgi:hypothetical protein